MKLTIKWPVIIQFVAQLARKVKKWAKMSMRDGRNLKIVKRVGDTWYVKHHPMLYGILLLFTMNVP